MRRNELPISALPAWSRLNDVIFYDINVHDIKGKGSGLVADRHLSSEEAFDMPVLLRVPRDLILSKEAVEEHSRVDKDFRDLLTAAGGLSPKGDILLFLLMQITVAAIDGVGVSNPWSEYLKMLPSSVPVPTTWTEEERTLLVGTSLELPLAAKMSALLREFERLQNVTAGIPWCQKVWWESRSLALSDWILIDSWYRSRCLELPDSGESMVPCLDIVNHARDANAYYEQTSNGDVVLLLRPSKRAKPGEEITISYGSTKSAAEMLFNYGFVDEDIEMDSLVLDLYPLPDDPLGKAKIASFSGRAVVHISLESATIEWSSPFLYFMILNEEDGLDFRVMQQTDGSQSRLQIFWQDIDITDSTADIEKHIAQQPLREVFSLRAVCVLQDRIHEQLERLYACEDVSAIIETSRMEMDERMSTATSLLRHRETVLLEKAINALETQKSSLIQSPVVAAYFNTIQRTNNDGEANATIDEDFS